MLLAGCGEEEPLYKAARREIESRPSCTRPKELTPGLAGELAGMGVLTCTSAKPADCRSTGAFADAVRLEDRRDPLFGQQMSGGVFPRLVMICGKARVDRFTSKRISPQSTLSPFRNEAQVEYVVTPQLSDDFMKQPQARDLLAKLGSPATFSSVIALVGDGNSWQRR